MISRRNLIKSFGLTTLALPAIPLLGSDVFNHEINLPDKADPDYWGKLRKQFMLADDKVFFNTGTVGVMPRPVVNAVTKHLNYMATDVADWAYKDDSKERFISGYQDLMYIRTKVGKIINCDPIGIGLTDNVTNAMSYIANGIELKAGDEILTTNQEHPGGRCSWEVREKRDGVIIKQMELPKPIQTADEVLDLVKKSFAPKTKVLMLSHVISGSGAILPVKEICTAAKSKGIFTVLDGAQTVGHIKVDIKDIGCDAYVGCFHKWIGAPTGTGFMYVDPQRIKEVWTTVASAQWDNHEDDGYRFTQRGTGNFSILFGLDAALDFYFEVGHDRWTDRVKYLGDRLRNGLAKNKKVKFYNPKDPSMCAGISVYNIDGLTGTKLQDAYWEKGRMRPRSTGDVYGVRHSTHIFNSEKEIDRAIEIINELSS
ncbi:MAG TPA: aminotransferase class V-fold PLP-dependent enzyme [Cyclobacteriaceae bacterium]